MVHCKRNVIALVATLLVSAACHESVGPDVVTSPGSRSDLNILRVAPQTIPAACTLARTGSCANGTLHSTGSPTEHFVKGFWAVRGRESVAQITYQEIHGGGGDESVFLEFRVPNLGLRQRPDGSFFSEGDSVLIEMTVDREQFLVRLSPSGLQFSSDDPAVLTILYSGANQDLDADGDVDADDEAILANRVGVWYQPNDAAPWDPVAATHLWNDQAFVASIYHFSGYAVGW